jgi:hypothetical protein
MRDVLIVIPAGHFEGLFGQVFREGVWGGCQTLSQALGLELLEEVQVNQAIYVIEVLPITREEQQD